MKTVRWFALAMAATVPASMFGPAAAFATPPVNAEAVTAGTPLSVEVPDPGCGLA